MKNQISNFKVEGDKEHPDMMTKDNLDIDTDEDLVEGKNLNFMLRNS